MSELVVQPRQLGKSRAQWEAFKAAYRAGRNAIYVSARRTVIAENGKLRIAPGTDNFRMKKP